MKNLLLGLLVLTICSCSKDEDKSNAEQASNKNEQTFLEKYDGKVWYDSDEDDFIMFSNQTAFLNFYCDIYYEGTGTDEEGDEYVVTFLTNKDNQFELSVQYAGEEPDTVKYEVTNDGQTLVKILDNETSIYALSEETIDCDKEQTFLEKYDGKVWYDSDEDDFIMFSNQTAFLNFYCDIYYEGTGTDEEGDEYVVTFLTNKDNQFELSVQYAGEEPDTVKYEVTNDGQTIIQNGDYILTLSEETIDCD